jgi:hypothetical protein
MVIKKFKVKDDLLEVTYTKKEKDGSITVVNETHEAKVHPDLLQAMDNLKVHFGLIIGLITVKQVKKIETPAPELLENIHVSGLTIKTGDDPGVIITGHYTTPWKKAAIMNTPFTRLAEAEESGYKEAEDLQTKTDRAVEEVRLYLVDGKKADDPQQQLGFPEPQNTNVEEAEYVEADADQGDAEVWKDGQRPNV